MAWWNTALSPAAKSAKTKANTETYTTICGHIKKLITELSCDLIALCEVSNEDVAYINSYLNTHFTNLEILDLTCDIGRTRFDIAVIYDVKKIHLILDYVKK